MRWRIFSAFLCLSLSISNVYTLFFSSVLPPTLLLFHTPTFSLSLSHSISLCCSLPSPRTLSPSLSPPFPRRHSLPLPSSLSSLPLPPYLSSLPLPPSPPFLKQGGSHSKPQWEYSSWRRAWVRTTPRSSTTCRSPLPSPLSHTLAQSLSHTHTLTYTHSLSHTRTHIHIHTYTHTQ